MEGDVQGVMARPEGSSEEMKAEQEKWYFSFYSSFAKRSIFLKFRVRDAWASQHSLSRTAAKRAYITTLIETMHKFASSTSQGRELVAELEFVWDQIKANSASSSNSSPGRGLGGPTDQQQQTEKEQAAGLSYASLGASQPPRAAESEGGLRLLRPFSDGDDAEDEEDEEFDDQEDAAAGERYMRLPNSSLEISDQNPLSKNLAFETRNRKWRKRIEIAMFKMATEVAALRESMDENKPSNRRGKHQGVAWAWIRWLVWVTIRQFLIDAVVVGCVFAWARRKSNSNQRRVNEALWLLLQALKEQVGRSRLMTRLRLPGFA
ncbi:MAG: hypothetical protein Q9190_007314 [Brigantiaea leucoxantha]